MRFGFNYGVGAGSSRYRNSYLISYLMDTIYTDGAMDRFLDNVGSNGSNNDAIAYASNFIYLNGTTQSVPYPVLHDLGSELLSNNTLDSNFAGWTDFNLSVASWNSADGGKLQLDTTANESYVTQFENIVTGKYYKVTFDIYLTQASTGLTVYDGATHQSVTSDTISIDTWHPIEYIMYCASDYNRLLIRNSCSTATDTIYADNIYMQEITLPSASYLTILQADGTIKQLSSTGDSGGTLAVSTVHSETASHQFVFNSTSTLTAEDISAIEADPNLAFRMFLNGEVLPSGFSRASNMVNCNFYGGNSGLVSGAYEQDLGAALGSEEFINGEFTTDLSGWTTSAFTWDNGRAFGQGVAIPVIENTTPLVTNSNLHVLTFDVELGGFAYIYIYNEADSTFIVPTNTITTDGTHAVFFNPVGSADVLRFYLRGGDDGVIGGWIDNISSREASAVEIIDYDSTCRTTLANQSYGATNLKLIQDGSGRTTGIAVANTTQWKADGRTAVTNWTITAPFIIAEIIDGDTYLFTSDGNRFKNLIADGTYTVPTGVWTLDEFGFDGVTPVTARGGTGMVDEVIA